MDGVDILSTSTKVVEAIPDSGMIWIAIGITMSIFVMVGIIVAICKGNASFLVLFLLIGMLVSTISAIFTGKLTATSVYETYYKVTIDNNVSMNDFMAKYEIVDHEDKIYTVKEK